MANHRKTKDSPLTFSQIAVLKFIQEFTGKYLTSPTFSEIAIATGIKDPSTARYTVRAMIGRGFLQEIQIPGRENKPVSMPFRLTEQGIQAIGVAEGMRDNPVVKEEAPPKISKEERERARRLYLEGEGSIVKTSGLANGCARINGTVIPVWLVVKHFNYCMSTVMGGYDNVYACLSEYFPSVSVELLSDAVDYSIMHEAEIADDTINNDVKVTSMV